VSWAEVHAALARKRRDGGVSAAQFRVMADAFEREWPAYDQLLVDSATLAEVRRLVRRHPLRGFDAIHLSAALWLQSQLDQALEFWVSDERLEAAAAQERLIVVNPEIERWHGLPLVRVPSAARSINRTGTARELPTGGSNPLIGRGPEPAGRPKRASRLLL